MRVVLTGASGQLGSTLLVQLVEGGHEVRAWSGSEVGTRGPISLRPVDLTEEQAVARELSDADPEVVIHTAALSSAEAVRRDPVRGRAVNTEATARLAAWCAEHDRRIVYTSTDLVFDGSRSWSREDDPAEPILAYGRTKHDAEPAVLAVLRGLVVRMSLMYGPSRSGRASYYERTIAGLREGTPQAFFEDEYRTPLDLESAARILVHLAESEVRGLLHVAGPERVSRFDLVRRQAIALGLDPALVVANRQADLTFAEPRPVDVSLDTSKLRNLFPDLHLPKIEEAVMTYR
ncbi:dTDP-4-dehydrorhamnose reductase [Singulisphaera sp. GP187]|uniref:SDR family oxidoreductase n=1 Tax=Singulisphaera sp. GP187 TaxID=1882752 RepID=UPI000925A689|nr:SDR family oxidoreductase [Singulisphaera sp. GP187]SIO21336.1 dTDP-4-dehydrorhamnose reductase [Singulisphaera sp. GP187]